MGITFEDCEWSKKACEWSKIHLVRKFENYRNSNWLCSLVFFTKFGNLPLVEFLCPKFRPESLKKIDSKWPFCFCSSRKLMRPLKRTTDYFNEFYIIRIWSRSGTKHGPVTRQWWARPQLRARSFWLLTLHDSNQSYLVKPLLSLVNEHYVIASHSEVFPWPNLLIITYGPYDFSDKDFYQ